MRRRRRNRNDFIRPTFNKGRFFVGGSLKKRLRKKRTFYGKGLFGGLLLSAIVPKILDKVLWRKIMLWKN